MKSARLISLIIPMPCDYCKLKVTTIIFIKQYVWKQFTQNIIFHKLDHWFQNGEGRFPNLVYLYNKYIFLIINIERCFFVHIIS